MNFTITSFGARFALSLSIFLILVAPLIGQTTPQLTLLKDIQIGSASSNPENVTSLFNKVVFTADNGINGKELWASDGTEAGTTLIKDFVVGSGSPVFSSFVELGGIAFFTVTFNETPQRIELWKTEGTPLSTVKVFSFTDALPNISFNSYNPFTANNKVYIPISQVTAGQNVENALWESNGFPTGTRNLGAMTLSFQNNTIPTYYYEKGQPLFVMTASNSCSNPVGTGSIIVIDSSGIKANVPFGSSTSPGACYAKTLGVMGRNLYFLQANTVSPTPSTKVSLFKVNTDGVKTVVIDSFSTYSRMTNALSGIRSVASNNWLYFFYEMQMWKSDGTTFGTVPITTRQSDTEPTDLMTSLVDGDAVYFTDNFSRFRYWRSINGSNPVLLGSESSPLLFISLLKKVGNKIYSFGNDPTDMPNPLIEIKSTDGQTPFIKIAESRQIRYIPSIGSTSNALFFGFNDPLKGIEIGTLNLNPPVIAACDTDRIAPIISSCPQNINLTTTGTSAVASWTTPTATDNCTSTPSVSSNYTSGSPFGVGTTAVTYTATDAKNNTATCRFNVTVGLVNNSCRYNDSLQLVSLYNATGGANWTIKWNLSQPINTWYGVTLNIDGCVQTLDIQSNQLAGNLPNLNLPNLESLILVSNPLIGTIPNFNLPNLKVFALVENQFSGFIPNFNLPNLQYLDLQNNQLSGTIPNFNLPNLKDLILYKNQLSGTIPNFNLPSLETIHLEYNKLTGTIPNFNLPNLVIADLGNNLLSGTIPNLNLPNLNNISNYLGSMQPDLFVLQNLNDLLKDI